MTTNAIDYGRQRRKRSPSLRRILVAAILATIVWCGWTILTSTYSYFSVCPICGEIQGTTEWQIPFTDFTYFKRSHERASSLSNVLAAHHCVETGHVHDWHFVHGSGNGVGCALGDGQGVWEIANRLPTIDFIDATLSHADPIRRNELIAILRNPSRARELETAIVMSSFPDSPVTAKQYGDWERKYRGDWDSFWATASDR